MSVSSLYAASLSMGSLAKPRGTSMVRGRNASGTYLLDHLPGDHYTRALFHTSATSTPVLPRYSRDGLNALSMAEQSCFLQRQRDVVQTEPSFVGQTL
jgi:hypothetical protein